MAVRASYDALVEASRRRGGLELARTSPAWGLAHRPDENPTGCLAAINLSVPFATVDYVPRPIHRDVPRFPI
jgi:hypothetical protein